MIAVIKHWYVLIIVIVIVPTHPNLKKCWVTNYAYYFYFYCSVSVCFDPLQWWRQHGKICVASCVRSVASRHLQICRSRHVWSHSHPALLIIRKKLYHIRRLPLHLSGISCYWRLKLWDHLASLEEQRPLSKIWRLWLQISQLRIECLRGGWTIIIYQFLIKNTSIFIQTSRNKKHKALTVTKISSTGMIVSANIERR